jgi:hypothetical protein
VTVVCALGPTVTAAGAAPHVTPPAPLHEKLNVFDAEPVFVTVNTSEWPPVLAIRVAAAPPSGVTLTPYATMGTE